MLYVPERGQVRATEVEKAYQRSVSAVDLARQAARSIGGGAATSTPAGLGAASNALAASPFAAASQRTDHVIVISDQFSKPRHDEPVRNAGDLGRLVRIARENRKLSQQSFADVAGVGRRFLSELENGKPTLEIEKVLKVANAAGIDLIACQR